MTATGAGLVALPFDIGLTQGLGLLPAATILITLALIDCRYQWLPDRLTQRLLWSGMLFNLVQGCTPLHDAVIGATLGYL